KRMHLVQFVGPVQPAWRDEVEATGVQIVAYIPENAYLVYGDAQSIGQLQALAGTAAHVQWEAAYLDEYKIHPAARTVDKQGNPRKIGTDIFAIQLVNDPVANTNTLQLLDLFKLEPMDSPQSVLNYMNVIVRLALADLRLVA